MSPGVLVWESCSLPPSPRVVTPGEAAPTHPLHGPAWIPRRLQAPWEEVRSWGAPALLGE